MTTIKSRYIRVPSIQVIKGTQTGLHPGFGVRGANWANKKCRGGGEPSAAYASVHVKLRGSGGMLPRKNWALDRFWCNFSSQVIKLYAY